MMIMNAASLIWAGAAEKCEHLTKWSSLLALLLFLTFSPSLHSQHPPSNLHIWLSIWQIFVTVISVDCIHFLARCAINVALSRLNASANILGRWRLLIFISAIKRLIINLVSNLFLFLRPRSPRGFLIFSSFLFSGGFRPIAGHGYMMHRGYF